MTQQRGSRFSRYKKLRVLLLYSAQPTTSLERNGAAIRLANFGFDKMMICTRKSPRFGPGGDPTLAQSKSKPEIERPCINFNSITSFFVFIT